MPDETLFELPEPEARKLDIPTRPGMARVRRAVRNQMEMRVQELDSVLDDDHPARAIWAMLERLDLSAFYADIKAVIDRPGRDPSDPCVLLGLWLLATAEGVGSARQLDRLCAQHDAYRWMCGGVPVNYHLLSDFRVANQKALDQLLTNVLALLMSEGLLKLRHVAQDGMRVRASVGASSFHRKAGLEKCVEKARARVQKLAQEREHPDPGISVRKRKAQERAAKERLSRMEKALEMLPEMQAIKDRQRYKAAKAKKGRVTEARVSTTDHLVQVMKMPDGGFRPALNVELAADVDSQVIVGVDVITVGSDGGQALPMVEKVIERTGRSPEGYLMDGGFVKREDITAIERRSIPVYAPTSQPRTTTSGRTKAIPRADDTPEVARWRQRMETDEGKTIYKERAATAECVNARARALGLRQFTVRGVPKALSVVLLVAITHNLLRWITLTS